MDCLSMFFNCLHLMDSAKEHYLAEEEDYASESEKKKKIMSETDTLHPPSSSSLYKRMESDICFRCHQQGHWASPLNSSNTRPLSPLHSNGSHSPKICEKQRKMSETDTLHPPSSSSLYKRMESDTCFRCHQQGHWASYCPLNSSNTRPLSPLPSNDSHSSKIWCRCGHGFCEVKTAQNDRNRGRKYYACPIKRGKTCKDFVKWCDDPTNESDLQPPQFKYPVCECKAGVCRRVKATESTDAVKYYFTCPIQENHGSCGYLVWENELLDNKSIVPIQQSSQRTLNEFQECYQNEKTVDHLSKGGDLLVEHLKRMRIMENSENLSLMADSELSAREDATLKEPCSKRVGFPTFEDTADFQDLDFANSVSWESIVEKALLLSPLSTPSRISCLQNMFQRHIFAGPYPIGWLGRLIFFRPTHSLKFPTPQPFLCCVFPSFNPIIVPEQASIPDGFCKRNQVAISSLSQHPQLSTGCHTEVSRDVVSPNKSLGSERKPMSMAQRLRQMVLFAQKQLLIDLETLDPHELESMIKAAEDTFAIFDNLEVDYKQFSEHIWDFINLASSVAEMDKSMENSLTLEEHNKCFEEEKVRYACIHEDCVKTETLFQVSDEHIQSLGGEIFQLEAMLHVKQNQLKSCKLENLKIKTNLDNLNRNMLEAETALKVRAEQVKITRKLREERQAKQIAAKSALEKVKLELQY